MTPRAPLTRRKILQHAGLGLAGLSLASIAACKDEPGGANANADATTADAETFADAETDAEIDAGEDAGADAGEDAGVDSGEDAGTAKGWATGGTAGMSGDYPDPFTGGLGDRCALTCSATLGPCYVSTLERMDISEGQNGLPVRFAFLIVDEMCRPIEGAALDIWHTSANGYYSGEDAPFGCTLGDPAAEMSRWFRGVQSSNAAGRVDFNSCFPGWYPGRTIHIHFTVRLNNEEYLTSQLYFDDLLSNEIIAAEPIYSDRGPRDTDNTTDGLISAAAAPDYSFQTARMSDGAMLAWKVLVIRSALATPLCNTPT